MIGYWGGYAGVFYSEPYYVVGTSASMVSESGKWIITVATSDGAIGSLYTSGSKKISGVAPNTGPNGLALGCRGDYSECSSGQIAETIIYSRVLSDSEWMHIVNYLKQKYALTF